MSTRLRILHLEDDPDYARFVQDLLNLDKVDAEVLLVKSRAEFESALTNSSGFDIILADYSLPDYTGLQALATARESAPQIPFLLVSGTIGEQAAIDSLQAGATDYVLKPWTERLIPAIKRAVRESQEHERRAKAEAELVRREKYFRALTENALDVLTILNLQGDFVYNSPSIERMLGYDPKELVGKNAFSFIHAEDLPRVMVTFQRAIEHPELQLMETFRFKHKDESWHWIEVVGRNRLNDPEIGGVVINTRDVSERKTSEAALRSSELLFHAVWENSLDGMRLTDEDGIIVAVNEAFCKLVRLTREQLVGKPFTVAYSERDDREALQSAYRKKFASRQVETQFEFKATLHDGRPAQYEVTKSYIELAGHPAMMLSLFGDVTAQRRLEEQLRQSQKMEAVGQLAGGVAHDFNNILTVIQGHASLLQAAGELSETAAKSVQQITRSSERAAGLTKQLLTFSRRQVMQPQRLDMNDVASNLSKMLARVLGENIDVHVDHSPHPALVNADAGMIEQMLLNLSVNARDAMPKGGQLTIGISVVNLNEAHAEQYPESRAGRFVRLVVADTGSGISLESLPRIFEPFFTTKEVGKGTGLGLATVYGIINQHHGWIEVESEIDHGTTFRAFLPSADDGPSIVESAPPETAVSGGTETILVVEDEAPVRQLVCNVLGKLGYKVFEAASGVEALKVWNVHKEKIDLLLTDLVMPGQLNGRELAENLLAERPGLKVMFTSGYSADIVGQEFVLKSGLHYLQKPYHPKNLARAVRDCLDGRNG